MTMPLERVLRSQLFVPANRPEFIARAGSRGADAIIVDLEDSVPLGAREVARQGVSAALQALSGEVVFVRVNHDDSLRDDLEAVVRAHPSGVLVPKVETPEQVRGIDDLLRGLEKEHGIAAGTIRLQLLVESSRGVLALPAIAQASPRIISVMLGVEDLAAELEVEPGSPYFDLAWAHGALVVAARAAGVAPYGLMDSLSNYADLVAFKENVRRSRGFGYLGACCIHPVQVPIVNEGFAPTAEEVRRARGIVAAFEEALVLGQASASFEGKMIDPPVVERARRLLARA